MATLDCFLCCAQIPCEDGTATWICCVLCAVLPVYKRVAAMPDAADVATSRPCILIQLTNTFNVKVCQCLLGNQKNDFSLFIFDFYRTLQAVEHLVLVRDSSSGTSLLQKMPWPFRASGDPLHKHNDLQGNFGCIGVFPNWHLQAQNLSIICSVHSASSQCHAGRNWKRIFQATNSMSSIDRHFGHFFQIQEESYRAKGAWETISCTWTCNPMT